MHPRSPCTYLYSDVLVFKLQVTVEGSITYTLHSDPDTIIMTTFNGYILNNLIFGKLQLSKNICMYMKHVMQERAYY